MTRTEATLEAIQHELATRRAQPDASSRLVQVQITVKYVAETGAVRGVTWNEERLWGGR